MFRSSPGPSRTAQTAVTPARVITLARPAAIRFSTQFAVSPFGWPTYQSLPTCASTIRTRRSWPLLRPTMTSSSIGPIWTAFLIARTARVGTSAKKTRNTRAHEPWAASERGGVWLAACIGAPPYSLNIVVRRIYTLLSCVSISIEQWCLVKLARRETEVTNSADAGTGSDAVRTRRRYRQLRRAELEAQTRLRITEAAMKLHGTVGPLRTTVTAVAEEAGVQRGTVYRHFPDEDALSGACSMH